MSSRKLRVVVAGQTPPPFGGQNIMIARIIEQLRADPALTVLHLPFYFTRDFQKVRTVRFEKVAELLRILLRMLQLRRTGPIDLLLYPSGGPHRVPMIRDILLLPSLKLFSKRIVIQFHAAGAADALQSSRTWMFRLLRAAYRCATAAIVMTDFNRRDPAFLKIEQVAVIPYAIPDEKREPSPINDGKTRLLYVGHLCADKGTPHLLQAFARLQKEFPDTILELVGEVLPPWSEEKMNEEIERVGLRERVRVLGLLTGAEKARVFGRANLFVFPTVAQYESFGVVTVEAMMWSLPVVLTDWRGNRDVVGSSFGGICFQPVPDLVTTLAAALREALLHKSRWSEWGATNRRIYLERYEEEKHRHTISDFLHDLISDSG